MAKVEKMSAPRLQLRWVRNDGDDSGRYEWLCHYELALPLREHDIRRELEDGGRQDELVVMIKEPSRRGSNHVPCSSMAGERYFDTPYRDGAHAKWDSAHLGGIPVYAIAPDGTAFLEEVGGDG